MANSTAAFIPPAANDEDYLRLSEVKAIVKVSTSTIYKWMAEGTFPSSKKLSGNCVRWERGAVNTWKRTRPDTVTAYKQAS